MSGIRKSFKISYSPGHMEQSITDFNSEGLEGDAEMELNEEMDERGEWEDEEEEIAAG